MWIKHQPTAWKLTPELFEQVIEYLEVSCARQVPQLDDLLTQSFCKHQDKDGLAASYDYWLDRRLREKKKLCYYVKTKDDRVRRNKKFVVDPYVAFRQGLEYRHTRRNRAAEHKDYIRMLQLRRELAVDVKFLKTKKIEAETEREVRALKFRTFERLYRNGIFGSRLVTPSVPINSSLSDFVAEPEKASTIQDEAQDVGSATVDEGKFSFKPSKGCQYYKVRRSIVS